MDSEPRNPHVYWRLAFTNVHQANWWDRWLKPGFRHVYAFREVGPNQWLTINPRSDHCEIALEQGLDHNGQHCYLVADDENTLVLNVLAEVPEGRLRSRWFLGPITCVEFVKALLGVRAFGVFTPWQLYNYVRQCRGTIRQAENSRTLRV